MEINNVLKMIFDFFSLVKNVKCKVFFFFFFRFIKLSERGIQVLDSILKYQTR